MSISNIKTVLAALFCAAFAVSCEKGATEPYEQKNIVTMRSDSLTVLQSENGGVKTRFFAESMEEYKYAPEPYREYSRGIDMHTFDTLGNEEASIRANYALFWISLDRWDLKGDVVVQNAAGEKIETQQGSWSQKTGMIWSNVQTRLTRDGDVTTASGFEATDDLRRWRLRHGHGTQSFNAEPNTDTTFVE